MDLSDFFNTKSQAADFSSRLANTVEELYKTGFNLEKTLMEHFGIEKKDKFITLLRDNNIPTDSVPAVRDFLTKIQEGIANIPVLPIIIAFEPKEQTLKTLAEWFSMNLKKQVLFDIKVDKKLIAGAAITYNGKFKDYSIRAKFDEIAKEVVNKSPQVNSGQAAPPPAQTPAVHQNPSDIHMGR